VLLLLLLLLGFGGTGGVDELTEEEERGGSSGLVGGRLQLGASRSGGHEGQRLDAGGEIGAALVVVARQQREIVVGGAGSGLTQGSLRNGMEHSVVVILLILTGGFSGAFVRRPVPEIHTRKRVEAIMPGSLHASRGIVQKRRSAGPPRRRQVPCEAAAATAWQRQPGEQPRRLQLLWLRSAQLLLRQGERRQLHRERRHELHLPRTHSAHPLQQVRLIPRDLQQPSPCHPATITAETKKETSTAVRLITCNTRHGELGHSS
jgi:hypothetical protein